MRGRPRAAPAETSTAKWRAADGRWHARVTVGRRLDGQRDRRHLTRGTKRELDAAVRELENARDAGEQPWLLENMSVGQWLTLWMDTILPLSVRWKTRSGYVSLMRVHVIPNIGSLPLADLRPETLEQLYRQLLDEGRSVHVVHAVHRTLRSSLSEAVRRKRLVHNPAAIARPPRMATAEIEPLTPSECQDILNAAQATPNPARWSVALALGLRQGEALGLEWSDIELDQGILRVRRSVQRRTWSHGCHDERGTPTCGRKRGADCPKRASGGLLLVEPKTRSSRRIPSPASPPRRRTAGSPGRPAPSQARSGECLGPLSRPGLLHRLRHTDRPRAGSPGMEGTTQERRSARGAPPRRTTHGGHLAPVAGRGHPHRDGHHGLDRDGHRAALRPCRGRAPPRGRASDGCCPLANPRPPGHSHARLEPHTSTASTVVTPGNAVDIPPKVSETRPPRAEVPRPRQHAQLITRPGPQRSTQFEWEETAQWRRRTLTSARANRRR